MSTAHATTSPPPNRYRRKLRNYLLDVSLQLRYTALIVIVAMFLIAGLGYKMYEATRETSKVIQMTGLLDPATAEMLQQQFEVNDRIVLLGLFSFGIVLILSVTAMGILITHKVAGPLYKIQAIMARVRDGKVSPPIHDLRRGDELKEFYQAFREMHDSLRSRLQEDARVLGEAVSALETSAASSSAVDKLRTLQRRKEDSLEP